MGKGRFYWLGFEQRKVSVKKTKDQEFRVVKKENDEGLGGRVGYLDRNKRADHRIEEELTDERRV